MAGGRLVGGVVAVVAIMLAHAPVAAGSAWPRERGEGLLVQSLGVHALSGGPGGRRMWKSEAAAFGEYGLTRRVTLFGRAGLERVTVSDDTGSVTQQGLGGVEAGLRVAVLGGPGWSVAGSALLSVPGGGETGAIIDLSDSKGRSELRISAGRGGPRSYATVTAGWRDGAGGEAAETRLEFAAGRRVGEWVWVEARSCSLWSEGSPAAGRAAYSTHRAEAAVSVAISRRTRVGAAALASVAGRNVARERAALLTLWRKF